MINAKLRPGWDKLMRPVGRWLARTPLSPDAVTLLGVLIQIGVAVLILQGHLLIAGLIAIVAALSDGFDGALAKAQGKTSNFGALLDSTTDRVADALYFIPIAWLYGVSPDVPSRGSHLVAGLALFAFVASFVVSYLKARAESLGFDCNVGIAERAERLIILIAALILDHVLFDKGVLFGVSILAVLAAVTVLQRFFHVRRQARDVVPV